MISERIVVIRGRIQVVFCRIWVRLVWVLILAWMFAFFPQVSWCLWQDLGDSG